MAHSRAVQDALASLAAAGFDLAHPFDAHALVAGWDALAAGPRLGYLVGNTRALWEPFTRARQSPPLAAAADPLERYTEMTFEALLPHAQIFYAHRPYAGAYLPFQALAVATGLGALAASRLVIHPTYGPWFALRAVVLVDGIPPATAPIAKPCVCTAACPAALEAALAGGDWRAWLAVRDACTIAAHRYSDEQIRYHYLSLWRPAT